MAPNRQNVTHLGTRSDAVFRHVVAHQFTEIYGDSELDVVDTLVSEGKVVEDALTRSLGELGLMDGLVVATHEQYGSNRRIVRLDVSNGATDYEQFDALPMVDGQELAVRGTISLAFFRRFYAMIRSADVKGEIKPDEKLELALRAGYRFMHARAYLGTALNMVYPLYRQSKKLPIANHILDAGRPYLIPSQRWDMLDDVAKDYYRFVTLPYRVASRYIIGQLSQQITCICPDREIHELYASMLENRMMVYGYAKDAGLSVAPIDIGLANPLSDTEIKAVLQGLHLLHSGLY